MHHLSHFQFLARRDVAATVVKIIQDEDPVSIMQAAERRSSRSSGELTPDSDDDSEIDSQKSAV